MSEREIQMFGCTKAEIDAQDAKAFGHPMMRVMSLLSNAQEEMYMGLNERARQSLNMAKYLISKHGFKDLKAPAPAPLFTDEEMVEVKTALYERRRWLSGQEAAAIANKNEATAARYGKAWEHTFNAYETAERAVGTQQVAA